ncbi:hypothetical protein IWW38_000166 [Coemansia aciculifera]|uniref:Uncharacterized protein n=1 Tax=Coemansia aciculifera TaxID=417176 RepID=A0ACC1MC40_9FUNG|nr:hypothetical protein IWW38_000166 [Coemansia aciculifera]
MSSSPPSLILSPRVLPDDVLFGIFSYCNGDDLREFSQVSRAFRAVSQDDYLWKVIYWRRFGSYPSRRGKSCREEYDQKDKMIVSIADECTIAHNHLPYWRRANDPRSVFGAVALLHAVSWLHVLGALRGVHTGKYNVIWRLAVMPRAQHLFNVKFSAETRERGCISASELPYSASLVEFGSDYFDFVLPQPIEITDPFEDVIFQCKAATGEWKTGITFCSVRLALVEATTASRARTWGNGSGLSSIRFTKEQRKTMDNRQMKNVRSKPGASYRPWRPWTTFQWYEVVSIGTICIIIAAVLVQLFFAKTRK